ncbi:MFS transporter [Micromonospora orduensis]|uniref:MFS transporter n=1 Tax=Micromonospora orduensis TaxID=1420891 RepID=UPI00142EE2CE|nr:MFS transporter [Micromonospora orduensis]
MPRNLSVLRDRTVATLLAARSISLLGNAIAPVALAFAVLAMPGGSATDLGLILAARTVTQVAFVLLGGVLADRLPKYRVMVGSDIAAAIMQAGVASLVILGHANLPALAVLAALNGAAAAVFEPASRSIMPQLVPADALQSANALLKFSMRGGSIIGAALAGLLVAAFGPGPALAVDAGTFLVSALVLMSIRAPRHTAPSAPGRTMLAQLIEGWREFTARQWVWAMVGQLAFVNILLAGSFYVLGPVVAEQSLGGAPAWSAILTAQAVGFVAGTFVAMRIRPRYPLRVAALMTACFSLSLFLLAGPAPLVLIAAAAFVAAICIDVFEVTIDTTLQQHIPKESLSRVMSYEALGSFAFVPLGMAAAGPVAEAVGVGPTLAVAGALIVLSAFAILLLPSVRNIRSVPTSDRAEGSPEPTVSNETTLAPDPAASPDDVPAARDAELRESR